MVVRVDENLGVFDNRKTDANYIALMGTLKLQQKSIDDVQKQVDKIEVDFKESMKDHKASNDKVVDAIRGEVKTLKAGFDEMANNLRRIQYILLGGALFYVLDAVGLKTFFIKIMGA